MNRKERKTQAFEALNDIHLSQLAMHFPDQISGGQRARISLMRMLLAQPKIILLDEPFSKLDQALRQSFRDWVYQHIANVHVPTLIVTHDIEDKPKNARVFHLDSFN